MARGVRKSDLQRFLEFATKHGVGHIPDRGFCVGDRRQGIYQACFRSKADARRAARLLVRARGGPIDLVQVQNRGNDRFIVGEFNGRR